MRRDEMRRREDECEDYAMVSNAFRGVGMVISLLLWGCTIGTFNEAIRGFKIALGSDHG